MKHYSFLSSFGNFWQFPKEKIGQQCEFDLIPMMPPNTESPQIALLYSTLLVCCVLHQVTLIIVCDVTVSLIIIYGLMYIVLYIWYFNIWFF